MNPPSDHLFPSFCLLLVSSRPHPSLSSHLNRNGQTPWLGLWEGSGAYSWRVWERSRVIVESSGAPTLTIVLKCFFLCYVKTCLLMCVCVCVHVFSWSTSPSISFLHKKKLSCAKGVSSIVGAPCNAVSLCNRAGWLGFGRKQSIG